MTSAFVRLRAIALAVAAFAYLVGGSHAGVVASENGELFVPICTTDGTKLVSVAIGDDGSASIEGMSCPCGIISAALTPRSPFPVALVAQSAPLRLAYRIVQAPETTPIWPGAPPIGPPGRQG